APVVVEYARPDAELALLARRDPDPFARWEAGQELARRLLLARVRAHLTSAPAPAADTLADTWAALLQDTTLSPAYLARVLALPAQKELLEHTNPMEPQAVVHVHRELKAELGRRLAEHWQQQYDAMADDPAAPYSPDPESAGRRALRALALGYLLAGGQPHAAQLALQQYENAGNMSDCMGALNALAAWGPEEARTAVYQHFYDTWQEDPLVIDRWFAVQASSPFTGVAEIQALMLHPAFSLRNPNRARSVVFQFCMNNPGNAHGPAGYEFWADQVLALDALNPEIAARLARAFDNWARYTPALREPARHALERIVKHPTLSRNVAEIVNKALSIHQEHGSMKNKSLTQYLVEQQRQEQAMSAELRLLIETVARACKAIGHAVGKGALGGVLGSLDTENVQGEVQKKLDVLSNEILLDANEWGGHLAAMASEEMETIHLIPNRYPKGEYLLLFDPLDGSSNIDV